MDINPTTVIEYEGHDGEIFTLAGPRAGNKGIWLGRGEVSGLLDPPVKVFDESVGSFAGSRFGGFRVQRRDVVFAVEVVNESGSKSWIRRDSSWRKAWAYDKPGKLYVTTKESGTRWLRVYLAEPMETKTEIDPNMVEINRTVMHVVAYDPWWYEDDIEFSAETQTDTTVSGTEDITFSISPQDGKSGGLNPTDQKINLTWALEAPGKYIVPDYDFEDPSEAARRISLPEILVSDGDVVATSDRRVEQVSSENNTPIYARMNGVRFLHKVPPYTEAKDFVVTASKTPPGHTVSLFLERPWSRAWGLE